MSSEFLFKSRFELFNEGAVKVYKDHPRKVQGVVLSKCREGVMYFVTFDVPSEEHARLCVSKKEFDAFNEGDRCELAFDGAHCTEIKYI